MHRNRYGLRFTAAGVMGLAAGAFCVFWGMVGPLEVSAQGKATATPILPLTDYSAPTPASPLLNVIDISSEHADTCALLDNGGVECWGEIAGRSGAENILGIKNAIAISSGGQHSCALLEDGTVKCWGYNSNGQLGDGSNEFSFDEAVGVKFLPKNVTAIGAGWSFTCAIANGEIWCWGANDSGQLGDGSMEQRTLPVKVVGLGAKAISLTAGYSHACALLEGGRVQCWGRGLQIDDTTQDRTTPVDIPSLNSDVVLVASKYWHTCALKSNGRVLCWGDNQYGQLGDGTTRDAGAPVPVQRLGAMTNVTTGHTHTCASNAAGDVFCWGDNRAGQLGNGTNEDSLSPATVVDLDGPATGLSAGEDFSCALVDSEVQCWGENQYHQLGTGIDPDSETPNNVENLSRVTSIAAGGDTSCVITSGGVRCWGENENGQVGDGSSADRDTAVAVTGLPGNVTELAIGFYHSCALSSNSVYCWGAAYSGQLANESVNVMSLTPVEANGLPPEIQAIAAGGNSACALAENGNLWCWGANDSGQLGDGTTERRETPVQVQGLNGRVTSFSVGVHYACAVVDAGVYCWGDNYNGQLGDGTEEDRLTPVAVNGLSSGIASVVAGEDHTCAITTSGGVKCWGYNINGQLGDGTNDERSALVDVINLSEKVTALSLGNDFTCALTENGGVKCWGSDSNVGNDTISYGESYSPVDVLGLTNNVAAIAAGRFHACVVLTDGTAKCWGTNWNGQLGNGEGPDSNVPVTVVLGERRYGEEEPTGAFRKAGPLEPEITTYIPTPLDVSTQPGVIGTNLLLAALMMLPFSVAAEFFTRTMSEHEEALRHRVKPVDWITRLKQRLDSLAGTRLERRPALIDALKLSGVMLFYGLVFSLLDRSWNPFSLKGLILFLSMTIAYGIVGVVDDIMQFRAIRKWGIPAELNLRPTNVLIAMLSTVTTRALALVPGLMFGTPEALQTDESLFDQEKRNKLLKISAITFSAVGLGIWLVTAMTGLLQRQSLNETAENLVGGLEGFLLIIFAVALENSFVQMLGFAGSFGQALKRKNRWLWLTALVGVTFLFYHTLLNPRGELAEALEAGNVRLFLGMAGAFIVLTFGLRMYFRRQERRAAESSKVKPAPMKTATKPEVPPVAPLQTEPVTGAPTINLTQTEIPSVSTQRVIEAAVGSFDETKQCPICGNQIKAEAKICRYCRSTFIVIRKGYCPTDHELVVATEDGKCIRCGSDVADLHFESRLLKAAAAKNAQVVVPPVPETAKEAEPRADEKTCPACGKTIKAEARLCRFCRARFEVRWRGYCLIDHAVVDVTDGKCVRCGNEAKDVHLESKLITGEAST